MFGRKLRRLQKVVRELERHVESLNSMMRVCQDDLVSRGVLIVGSNAEITPEMIQADEGGQIQPKFLIGTEPVIRAARRILEAGISSLTKKTENKA